MWTNGGGTGTWEQSENWAGSGVEGSYPGFDAQTGNVTTDDDARFLSTFNGTVTTQAHEIGSITISGGATGTVSLGGNLVLHNGATMAGGNIQAASGFRNLDVAGGTFDWLGGNIGSAGAGSMGFRVMGGASGKFRANGNSIGADISAATRDTPRTGGNCQTAFSLVPGW